MPAAQAAELLRSYATYVDVWKFGWGTAYLDRELAAKAVVLADYGVLSCLGGTLLEVAWAQGKADDLMGWAADKGLAGIEVSRGAAPMTLDDKHKLIDAAARRFTVLSEVGSKSVTSTMAAAEWATEVAADLDAGATWVLAEGRESGTVGIFHDDGVPRQDVVDAVVTVAGVDRIVFEAPRKDQQGWFIQRFGADVNLANIAPGEVLGLETLRLGLRADTMADPS